MRKRCIGFRIAAALLLATLLFTVVDGSSEARAQGSDPLTDLREQVRRLYNDGHYTEAISAAERYVSTARQLHGDADPAYGAALGWLAAAYQYAGRLDEAEPLRKRVLAIYEKAFAPDHPRIGIALNNLGEVYRAQSRNAEAEQLLRRSLAIAENAHGHHHVDVALAQLNLANVLTVEGKLKDAESLYVRSLSILEKAIGPDYSVIGKTLNGLANNYRHQERFSESEQLFKRALAVRRKALGPDHPDVGETLTYLAAVTDVLGRHSQSAQLYREALSMAEKRLGPEHPQINQIVSNLALAYYGQRDWARAAAAWRRGTSIVIRHLRRGVNSVGLAMVGKNKSEAERRSWQFTGLVRAIYRLSPGGRAGAAEMFEMAQWARASDAGTSLAQMAARGASGEAALARLVRERQDLVGEWQALDAARNAALAKAPAQRERAAEAVNAARFAAVDARLSEIDKSLREKFPNYAALANPTPLSVADVQETLADDEALIFFFDTPEQEPLPEETFVWVITRSEARLARSDLGTSGLAREVAALRCGLDASQWQGEGATKCAELLQVGLDKAPRDGGPLPFDTTRAHTLFKQLFGQFENQIRGKHLLVVPSGALTQLPFQVLVTAPASGSDYRATAWLASTHPLTVLPAVSSLRTLRQIGRDSTGQMQMLGVGNPLLDGDPATRPWEAQWAQLAREKQSCAGLGSRQVIAGLRKTRGVLRMTVNSRVALDQLRSQSPLHDTADELCAVAADLKVDAEDILLGARATEAAIKKLSASGRLGAYRIIHFATHGTLAGEIDGALEPGLILTPPKAKSVEDDGYLSASEVAALKLDADWVILSACNTAAGASEKADALSGLARAFLYAGARALLVSHWSVDSAATVKLIKRAVGSVGREVNISRPEALRRAMVTLINSGELHEAHPTYWAPFVVVGEGRAAK